MRIDTPKLRKVLSLFVLLMACSNAETSVGETITITEFRDEYRKAVEYWNTTLNPVHCRVHIHRNADTEGIRSDFFVKGVNRADLFENLSDAPRADIFSKVYLFNPPVLATLFRKGSRDSAFQVASMNVNPTPFDLHVGLHVDRCVFAPLVAVFYLPEILDAPVTTIESVSKVEASGQNIVELRFVVSSWEPMNFKTPVSVEARLDPANHYAVLSHEARFERDGTEILNTSELKYKDWGGIRFLSSLKLEGKWGGTTTLETYDYEAFERSPISDSVFDITTYGVGEPVVPKSRRFLWAGIIVLCLAGAAVSFRLAKKH